MDRRSALKIIGACSASPLLFTFESKKIVTRMDPDVIPTGFPVLDAAFGGGLRQGTINVIYGSAGSGKTALAKSIALSAAKSGAVTFFNSECQQLRTNKQKDWGLPFYTGGDTSHWNQDDFFKTADMFDVWVDDTPEIPPSNWIFFDNVGQQAEQVRRSRQVQMLHRKVVNSNCCFVTTCSWRIPLLYFASTVMYVGRFARQGFAVTALKNRWGKAPVFQLVGLQSNLTFTPF